MQVRSVVLLGVLVAALGLGACGGDSNRAASRQGDAALDGTIRIDGSTTVAPLTAAIARRFMAEHPGVRISIGRSGTTRGFDRLCSGQTDLAPAAEAIDARAIKACERGRVRWSRITVANDAVVLVVNRANPIRCLTTDQLAQIWRGNSGVTNHWSQIDGITPPYDEEFTAWGTGTDTETFAWFTWAVNRERGITRDYNNTLHLEVRPLDIAGGDAGILGYAGYRYYRTHPNEAKLLAVDSGDGCVKPSPKTIADGSFRPLARRLFLYVSSSALADPAVDAFLRFYLQQSATAARRVGFVALTPDQLAASTANLGRLIAQARR